MLWSSIQGETKVRLTECSYRSNELEEFPNRKIPVISVKEALGFTEQVQKLIAIADFELQKFGSLVRQYGSSTDYTDLFKRISVIFGREFKYL